MLHLSQEMLKSWRVLFYFVKKISTDDATYSPEAVKLTCASVKLGTLEQKSGHLHVKLSGRGLMIAMFQQRCRVFGNESI